MKFIICIAPAGLLAWFVSPILWDQGSSAAFDMAIGLPVSFAVAGIVGWANWR